jgi:regulator of protease activity HflC (stomatin/prohibitin superfamily)
MWDNVLSFLLPVTTVAVILYLIATFKRIIIFEYQRGVKFVNGKIVGVLEPGRHWLQKSNSQVTLVDIREKLVTLVGQELLSSDGNTIKLSLAASYKISDPILAITANDNYRTAVYTIIQLSLRKVVGGFPIEEVLEKRDQIAESAAEGAREKIAALGVELLSVDIKDIMFPGVLKQIFAEELRARKEGLAALERARGETAALRNLANAAKLMKDNPQLMQLRLIQAISDSEGNTLVLNLDPGSSPIPLLGSTEKK